MSSNNQQLAQIFYEIANFLQAEEIAFKPQAYRRAAQALEGLKDDISVVYSRGGKKAIKKIKGIGEHIAEKIEEYLKTGTISYYEKYKKKYPVEIQELSAIEGLGPKMVLNLYQKLGVRNLSDLEKAAREGRIRNLAGFGEKTEQNIIQGIRFLKKSQGRFLLHEIFPFALRLEKEIGRVEGVKRVDICGSLRRRKETIGDLDFLVASSFPKKVIDFVCSLPEVVKIWQRGGTKASVHLKQGFDLDVRVIKEGCYGAALQYFTGNKAHNIHLRKIAQEKGFKLNEYGLFKGGKQIAGETEESIYQMLALPWIPPEIRQDKGEIEAALKNELPCLLENKDIKGDLHCHSNWNGGDDSIEEMAEKAMGLGYEYLGISDHTQFLRVENGLNEKDLARQRKEIEKINNAFREQGFYFRVLQGAETNILQDGSVDIKQEALARLDYAIGGVHSHLKMSKRMMTERIIKAMKNPYINIIAHPTGRLLKRREQYKVDIGRLFRAAKETRTALEINASSWRLDLRDEYIREAQRNQVPLVINTDSHRKDHLENMVFGVAQARRGWAEKKHILNTQSAEKLLSFLRSNVFRK